MDNLARTSDGPYFAPTGARVLPIPPRLYTPEQRRVTQATKRALVWMLERDMVWPQLCDSRATPTIRYWTDVGEVTAEQRAYGHRSSLYDQGDLNLVWVDA